MGIEHRGVERRAQIVQAIVDDVVRNPDATVTLQRLHEALGVPIEAAARIVQNLVKAGILREVGEGVWSRVADGSPHR
jgi:DNA-binding IclR family transcriptional regulator